MTIPLSAIEGQDATSRLLQLDLTAAELQQVVLLGYTAAADCTDHEPRTFVGMMPWGRGLGHLRDLTAPRGWRADRIDNYETAAHPSNSHCVAISSGSPDTGRVEGMPRTRNQKGKMTKRMVERNRQLSLGQGTDVFASTGEPVIEDEDRETWLLLHYYDREKEEIRLELSCPSEMTGKQITDWRQRIIIDPVPFNGEIDVDIEDIDEQDLAIDIDVPRRAD
ncbi:MAG TPA: hypothetical protein VMB27_08005 [Solirubrobacteraceae bacterium]|nr:hypothetical protein [Solirubrobacteraceae bacterium]